MDFLKKKMKELMDDDDKKTGDTHGGSSSGSHGERAYSDPNAGYQGGYPPQHQADPSQGYPQRGFPQQQSYGQPGYGSPAPPQGPPAPYGAPPPMPPGWVTQWDQNSQRWFYIDQATGRSQWDPPAQSPAPQGPYAPPPGPNGPYGQQPGPDERGLFGNTHVSGQDPYSNSYGDSHGENKEKKEKKEKKGHSTAMLAAAGVGGVAAGAWVGHEMTEGDSDDEHKVTYVAAPAAAPVAPAPVADPSFQEPPPVPTHDADGSSISSSDRESLEEKREELIEAQEEYEEELEEAYDD